MTSAAPWIEARPSGCGRVLFVHGARSHVLGAVGEAARLELHALAGADVLLCIDRQGPPGRATTRIRIWSSRDRGASWTVDPSLDVSLLGPETRRTAA